MDARERPITIRRHGRRSLRRRRHICTCDERLPPRVRRYFQYYANRLTLSDISAILSPICIAETCRRRECYDPEFITQIWASLLRRILPCRVHRRNRILRTSRVFTGLRHRRDPSFSEIQLFESSAMDYSPPLS